MVKKTVKNTILKYGLINRGDKVLAALSGGADSVCLTHVLCSLKEELGIEVAAAHLNHCIRGSEADADAEFSKQFAKSLGIEFFEKSVDVPALAQTEGVSEETAGREARYRFFKELSAKEGFNKTATAHNKNDMAETIMMNFMRGSSLAGLSGIPCMRGDIIRPLINVSRSEIEEYCHNNGLGYVTDSTNLQNEYTRNKIRHKLIPLIESDFNANFINTVSKNAGIIGCEEEYISEAAKCAYDSVVEDGAADIEKLLIYHEAIVRRVIRAMIAESGGLNDVSSDFAEQIAALARKNRSGSGICLPHGLTAYIEYGRLVIDKTGESSQFEYRLPLNKDIYIKEAGITMRMESAENCEEDGAVYFSGVDVDNVIVRSRKSGDFFYPCGMTGKKKLKDYFIDKKVPQRKRNGIPVILSGTDVMYILGYRKDRRFEFRERGIKLIIN